MKIRAILLTLILALSLGSQAQNKDVRGKQYLVYGIGFYNLENLFDTINNNGKYDLEFSPNGKNQWNGQRYWSKINNLARCIEHMTTQTTPNGPAILGVSEIENRTVLEDLVKADPIKNRMYQIVHHDSPDRRGIDVGLLYNPRYFKVLNVNNHRLKVESNPGLRTRDQMCVTGILGGDTINVIVNHWPSRLGGQEQSSYLREAAAQLSKNIADSVWAQHPNQGVIVMGDLNDDPQDKSCAKILGGIKDFKKAPFHGFFNPWWKLLDSGIGTLAYKGQWNLFDQIIISGNLLEGNTKDPRRLHYWKAQVNNFDFLKDSNGTRQGYPLRTFSGGVWLNGFSDHFPTEVFLIKER